MTARTTPLIEVAAARVEIDGRVLLDDISLVTDATRIGVVGRNGSGKTTFARVLAGLQPVDAGRVRLAGVEVATDRRGALGAVGILFQNPDHQIIFPTVAEELGFGLRQMGLSRKEVARLVEAILRQFDRAHWRDAPIEQMSQGQRQLVCLMAILAMEPRVIVLDEPFAGLDIPTAMHLARVLDGIDAALVHVSHDPRDLAGYELGLWLEQGRIAREGPAGPVLRAFEAEMKRLGARDDLADLAG